MAGYVFDNRTAAKLVLAIEGPNPDNLAPLPPGFQPYGSPTVIQSAIRKDMTADRPKVAVAFVGTSDDFKTIIVTQGCRLPKSHQPNDALPEAIEGEQERCVRQRLESKGLVFFLQIFLLHRVLKFSHTYQRAPLQVGGP